MEAALQVLLLEPFWGGSHRAAAEGWMRHTRHRVLLESLPPRFWKWRMRGAALEFAGRIQQAGQRPDVLLVTSMVDLAHLKAALRDPPPALLYFHENQAAYPGRPGEPAAERDLQFAFTNLASVAAAERVAFNSAFQRRAFLEGMGEILRRMPDARPHWVLERAERISEVLPLGIEVGEFPLRPVRLPGAPPLVLWNHRWEHDKAPEVFFRVLGALADEGVPFRLAVAGESFRDAPEVFRHAREALANQVVHWGFVAQRAEYCRLLARADVVVSTARQENFGLSMVEAACAGAHPLAPAALSYPEVFPAAWHERCLYRDEDDLRQRLRCLLDGSEARLGPAELRQGLAGYDWQERAAGFDRLLALVSEQPEVW
ncbi:MAG TPA: DUF3524 domain-containing protein [Deferrisomatales bacterium]|nr:DUF3524 domain-containing protein [Deferrisomatales bacterium]